MSKVVFPQRVRGFRRIGTSIAKGNKAVRRMLSSMCLNGDIPSVKVRARSNVGWSYAIPTFFSVRFDEGTPYVMNDIINKQVIQTSKVSTFKVEKAAIKQPAKLGRPFGSKNKPKEPVLASLSHVASKTAAKIDDMPKSTRTKLINKMREMLDILAA